ncbi:GSCOCG00009929001-RA-CDS [Cotesia congregata]|nr:GSCOCG00009929001-RA-CDS [Cotesia congregata]
MIELSVHFFHLFLFCFYVCKCLFNTPLIFFIFTRNTSITTIGFSFSRSFQSSFFTNNMFIFIFIVSIWNKINFTFL